MFILIEYVLLFCPIAFKKTVDIIALSIKSWIKFSRWFQEESEGQYATCQLPKKSQMMNVLCRVSGSSPGVRKQMNAAHLTIFLSRTSGHLSSTLHSKQNYYPSSRRHEAKIRLGHFEILNFSEILWHSIVQIKNNMFIPVNGRLSATIIS